MPGPSLIHAAIFLVALAYSSVGHGGASGYLAVLALSGAAPQDIVPGALALNLVVASIAFLAYWRAGHFDGRVFWPFALASIPAAFLGGRLEVPERAYSLLLGSSLLWAAARLAAGRGGGGPEEPVRPPRPALALPLGAGIGLLSGVVGVGGGIFLSPLIILMGWAGPKPAAAASAAFIWVNSLAGLCGQLSRTGTDGAGLIPLALAATLGGAAGSHLGASRLKGLTLRRVLAAVLAVAAVKLLGAGLRG